ncbi:MAG: D-sedoheptulose 7-phosphate isomerase [Dissulfurispiraceae bacterium]|jgi:D-sedoheptulose 7-phosphate isomerase|nr:D-sedoheptulose 7-phosphate isomerase [Dissulfurispiraceae bacterium]
MEKKIIKAFEESARLKEKFARENSDLIIEVANLMAGTFDRGKKIILFGNGGSACDASHLAAEFVNRFKMERPGLPAIAINTDIAVLTSIANDYDYSEIFSRQVKTLGDEDDIVIALSTSGSSKNILKAVDAAKKKGMKIVVLTGLKGEKLASKADYSFVVPSEDTPRIQETHITLGHVLCQMIEEILFEVPRKR